jgi:putative addiction module component (TIGR02574 family)
MKGIALEDIKKLSVNERLDLLEKIWDSLADFPEALPLTEAQRHELDRRIADLERNPASVESWEQVKSYMKGRRKPK